MKHGISIFSVVGVALIIFGCEQEDLVSLQLTQSEYGAVSANNNNETIRWDIASFPIIGGEFHANPGGIDFALANDESIITFTGTGTFEVPDSHEANDNVTGEGTWATFAPGADPSVDIPTSSGRYKVIEILSFEAGPEQMPAAIVGITIVDNIGDLEDTVSGVLYLKIKYSDGSFGVLALSCRYPAADFSVPPNRFEGVTASKGPVYYWQAGDPDDVDVTNGNIFHFVGDHHHRHFRR